MPGTYTIEVSGTVGQRTEFATFEIVLEHPCPTTELTLQSSPFTDSTYVLKSEDLTQEWNIDSILTSATSIDCGEISVEFFNDDGSTLDQTLFSDDRTGTPYKFKTLSTEDVSKAGSYPIRYRAFYT